MKTNFKREFMIEQHRKKKTRSEILKMGKDLNLNAMFIKRTLMMMMMIFYSCLVTLLSICNVQYYEA